MRHLSLCAGIGGIDLGLRSVVPTLRTVAMVERECFCIAHLAAKMEEGSLDPAPIYPDLHRFPWTKYRGCVDLVSGGFPCQPFSTAGARKATHDPRHLWPVIRAGLAVLKPTACFFENVDGIASAKSPGFHSVLHHVLSDLEGLGFKATAGQYSAEEVGAPHIRKRWFILGISQSNHFSCGSETLADADCTHGSGVRMPIRVHPPRQEPDRRSASGELADPDCGRGQQDPKFCQLRSDRSEQSSRDGGQPAQGEASQVGQVADTNREGREGRLRGEQTRQEGWQTAEPSAGVGSVRRWPTRPGVKQEEWEPSRTIERHVGGCSDGLSNRVDRLRALGNAVVPDCAAKAFSELWHELSEVNND